MLHFCLVAPANLWSPWYLMQVGALEKDPRQDTFFLHPSLAACEEDKSEVVVAC